MRRRDAAAAPAPPPRRTRRACRSVERVGEAFACTDRRAAVGMAVGAVVASMRNVPKEEDSAVPIPTEGDAGSQQEAGCVC